MHSKLPMTFCFICITLLFAFVCFFSPYLLGLGFGLETCLGSASALRPGGSASALRPVGAPLRRRDLGARLRPWDLLGLRLGVETWGLSFGFETCWGSASVSRPGGFSLETYLGSIELAVYFRCVHDRWNLLRMTYEFALCSVECCFG